MERVKRILIFHILLMNRLLDNCIHLEKAIHSQDNTLSPVCNWEAGSSEECLGCRITLHKMHSQLSAIATTRLIMDFPVKILSTPWAVVDSMYFLNVEESLLNNLSLQVILDEVNTGLSISNFL